MTTLVNIYERSDHALRNSEVQSIGDEFDSIV